MATLKKIISSFTFLEKSSLIYVHFTFKGFTYVAHCDDLYLLARTYYRKEPLRGDKKYWIQLGRFTLCNAYLRYLEKNGKIIKHQIL